MKNNLQNKEVDKKEMKEKIGGNSFLKTALILFFLFTQTAKAHRNIPLQNRPRWSPYAFTAKRKTGLIPGYLTRSMYAFSHKNPSGLVDKDYSYTPYAFDTEHNGLVRDHGWKNFRYHPLKLHTCFNKVQIINVISCNIPQPQEDKYKRLKETQEQKHADRRERILALKREREKRKEIKRNDIVTGVYNYFEANNINFRQENTFKSKGKVISTNFILPEQGIVIKYQNFEEIEKLDKIGKLYHASYKQKWKEEAEMYKNAGFKIQHLTHGEKAGELEKLASEKAA